MNRTTFVSFVMHPIVLFTCNFANEIHKLTLLSKDLSRLLAASSLLSPAEKDCYFISFLEHFGKVGCISGFGVSTSLV